MSTYVRVVAAMLVPLMALGSSCARTTREIRLAFDEDEGMVEPAPAAPVELSDAEVAQGFRTLAQDPQLIALFRQPEGTRLRLLPVSHVLGDAFVPGYQQLCANRGERADCLDLLQDGAFDTGDRQRVAMSIAWHSVLSGVALELGRTVDPRRIYVMVTTAMVGFMAMLAFPEPITKIILIALTSRRLPTSDGTPSWASGTAGGRWRRRATRRPASPTCTPRGSGSGPSSANAWGGSS